MSEKLEETLIALLARVSQESYVSEERRGKLQELLRKYELEKEVNVPEWISIFITKIMEGKETGWQHFPSSGYSYPQVFGFLGELWNVVPMRYDDDGETMVFTFEQLGVFAVISLEGSAYKIQIQ